MLDSRTCRIATLAILLSSVSLAQVDSNLTLERQSLYPGEGELLILDMFNHGFSSEQVRISITMSGELGSSFTLDPTDISARTQLTQTFEIQTATSTSPGDYPVFVTVETPGETFQLTKVVKIAGWPLNFTFTVPTNDTGKLVITATNTGSQAVQFVNATLNFPQGFDPRTIQYSATIIPAGFSDSQEFSMYSPKTVEGGVSADVSFADQAGAHSFSKTIQLEKSGTILRGFDYKEAAMVIIGLLIVIMLAKALLK